jgi:hypothetical protein
VNERLLWVGGLVLGGVAVAAGVAAATKPKQQLAPSPGGCAPQPPQPFLIRTNYLKTPGGLPAANKYRTEKYGYLPGLTDSSWNPATAASNAVPTTFFGLPITLNRRVVPVLKCVEQVIKSECVATLYTPRALSGLRNYNSYHGGEISNHMWGIAIDIDPDRNPCCGCVGHWANDPRCARPFEQQYDLPNCWIGVFERYGFYWLGHDEHIRDTMHFEFLGDPELVG